MCSWTSFDYSLYSFSFLFMIWNFFHLKLTYYSIHKSIVYRFRLLVIRLGLKVLYLKVDMGRTHVFLRAT